MGERFDKLHSYFVEKERKRLDAITKENKSGLPEMSPAEIKLSCLENGGYENPILNEKLFLHFRGFKKIENLEPYTGCKAIWLDSNGFEKIENLDALCELRCLYLSKNLISRIDGLGSLEQLVILDLSYNRITHLENLSCCPNLQTLNLARNFLATPDSIRHLQECKSLHNLDVTNNKLEAEEEFLTIFSGIPALKALSCNGNEISRLPHFRKRLIHSMPYLGYLDRPVDERERYIAKAFAEGGADAEKAAIESWREVQYKKKQDEMEAARLYREVSELEICIYIYDVDRYFVE
jgi:dynein assembly factor 1, axonemal